MTHFQFHFEYFFSLHVIELYRLGFKRLLGISGLHSRLKCHFILYLNIDLKGLEKYICHNNLMVDIKHSVVFFTVNTPWQHDGENKYDRQLLISRKSHLRFTH